MSVTRLLTIDDEAFIQHALRKVFSGPSFDCRSADNCLDGLAALKSFRPHVIVLDVHLPDASGLETFDRIRKHDARVPVILITGHGTTDLAGALRAAGDQLRRSKAARKITVLLSDCRATVEGDVRSSADALSELVIIAPEQDCEEAMRLALDCGARVTTVAGPSRAAEALEAVLER